MARVTSDNGLETDVGVVIAAGGCGERFAPDRNKLLAPLRGLPVVCHCLQTFARIVPAELIILVVPEELRQRFTACLQDERLSSGILVIAGGQTRQDSVLNGLAAMPPAARIVAVHDAARPYTEARLIRRCIDSAREQGSGVAARKVTNTIKVAGPDRRVLETKDRSVLWATETPQVFDRETLTEAYAHVKQLGISVTDESQAVEVLGKPVFLVEHTGRNAKITYPIDLRMHCVSGSDACQS